MLNKKAVCLIQNNLTQVKKGLETNLYALKVGFSQHISQGCFRLKTRLMIYKGKDLYAAQPVPLI